MRDAYDFCRTGGEPPADRAQPQRRRFARNPEELARLARRLNYDLTEAVPSVEAFRADAARHAAHCRALFQQVVGEAACSS